MHETHRKRFLHSPWVGRDFVPKFPDLKLVIIIIVIIIIIITFSIIIIVIIIIIIR